MGKAKAMQDSPWRDGFLFVGNDLALDFLNTRPIQDGEAVELLPDFDALLRWFQAAGALTGRQVAALRREWTGSARARSVVEAMRELREKLRKEVLAREHGSKLHHGTAEELNRLLTEHPMLTKLKSNGSGYTTELWFDQRGPEELFAPVALSAAKLFAKADWNRVRKCGNCVLHFYDTSKKGTRNWCSMQLCGNRLKVAAYAARLRRQERN